MLVRAARASDAAASALDVERDGWRPGANRRSFVAIGDDDRVLGHCRGIDNVFHPGSRVLVLEVADGVADRAAVADALLGAQLDASTLPLQLRLTARDVHDVALAARHDGRAVQLMPPWRYEVDRSMREWAATHPPRDGTAVVAIDDVDPRAVADLFVAHYVAQHAAWLPAAPPDVLRTEFADLLTPGHPGAYDPERSVALVRDGVLVAQSLVDGEASPFGREVVCATIDRRAAGARRDLEACLAGVVDRSHDGDALLVDAHCTEPLEMAMMADVPGPPPHPDDEWAAIVLVPLPGARVAVPPSLRIPDAAAWARPLAD